MSPTLSSTSCFSRRAQSRVAREIAASVPAAPLVSRYSTRVFVLMQLRRSSGGWLRRSAASDPMSCRALRRSLVGAKFLTTLGPRRSKVRVATIGFARMELPPKGGSHGGIDVLLVADLLIAD